MTEEIAVLPMEENKEAALSVEKGEDKSNGEEKTNLIPPPKETNMLPTSTDADTKPSEQIHSDKLVERVEKSKADDEEADDNYNQGSDESEGITKAEGNEDSTPIGGNGENEQSMPGSLAEKGETMNLVLPPEDSQLPASCSIDTQLKEELQSYNELEETVNEIKTGDVKAAKNNNRDSDESSGNPAEETNEGTSLIDVQNDPEKAAAAEKVQEHGTTPQIGTSESPTADQEHQEKETSPPLPPRPQGHPAANAFPRHCKIHAPTLEELQSQSFSDYIQKTVLRKASVHYIDDDDDDEELYIRNGHQDQTMMEFTEGIAKVSLPNGFWKEETIGGDRTGRGPAWQKGTPLGDLVITSPMVQNLRGVAGIYEYTFTDEKPLTLAEFREKADEYRHIQAGCADEEEYSEARLAQLERHFWKRLGPTMPPAWYGADQEGTLFGDDPASGWSVGELDSCLHVLSKVPGVTTPYLYAGMFASVFCAHTEDMNLLSINYLHAGAPKIWYAVAPGKDATRFEALAEAYFTLEARSCKEFLRHKRALLSPATLRKAGIPYQTAIQMPGEAVITFPGGYHFGFNAGFNMAEATNFGVPEWIPYGLKANVCLCRPDSVRIDMQRLISMLERYERDHKKEPELSWKAWSRRREEKKLQKKEQEEKAAVAEALNVLSTAALSPAQDEKSPKPKLSEQQKKKEFWVEVMKPVSNAMRLKAQQEAARLQQAKLQQARQQEPKSPEPLPGKRIRKKKRHFDEEQEEREKKKVEPPKVVREEIWHLAKPISRKGLELQTRVLCLLPGEVMESTQRRSRRIDIDDEDEQCFAGHVAEISDDHVRVHFDGLTKAEDVWIEITSPKLFVDSGRWSDKHEKEGIPKRHFWQEADSKRRCIAK